MVLTGKSTPSPHFGGKSLPQIGPQVIEGLEEPLARPFVGRRLAEDGIRPLGQAMECVAQGIMDHGWHWHRGGRPGDPGAGQ